MNSLHDVMAVMTRRLEQMIVNQDELFDVSFKKIGHCAQMDDAIIDLTEQTVSLREKTSARTSGVDGGVERLERKVSTCTEASIPAAVSEPESGTQQRQPGETLAEEVDEEESMARFGDNDVPIATQDIRAKEQSTYVLQHDNLHVSVRHSGPVKLGEALSLQLEWYMIAFPHTPNVRSVNSGPSDDPGVDITRLVEEKAERFYAKLGVG